MGEEAGVEALLDIGFLAVAAEGDGGEGDVLLAEGAEEIEAGAVGEADVAEEEVEGL